MDVSTSLEKQCESCAVRQQGVLHRGRVQSLPQQINRTPEIKKERCSVCTWPSRTPESLRLAARAYREKGTAVTTPPAHCYITLFTTTFVRHPDTKWDYVRNNNNLILNRKRKKTTCQWLKQKLHWWLKMSISSATCLQKRFLLLLKVFGKWGKQLISAAPLSYFIMHWTFSTGDKLGLQAGHFHTFCSRAKVL